MITLQDAKLHLRVDHDDEDDLIDWMLEAAIEGAEQYLNVEISTLADPELPAPIRAAVLLVVGDLYQNRERLTDRQLFANNTFELLLNPYRVMGV